MHERPDEQSGRLERADRRLERAHARARGRGVPSPLYLSVRLLVALALRCWFRVRIAGAERIPPAGAAIVAPNHKSFFDAFFVAIATRRRVRYMAKTELFRGPFAALLVRLGAFPVRRGESDLDAMETARVLLEQGDVVVVFPEGTRVEQLDALGAPHHGAGRLALETGAPIVPTAIAGTARLWRLPVPKLRRVQLSFLEPIDPRRVAAPQAEEVDALTRLVDEELWPAVQDEYGRQLSRPGLAIALLAAIGLGGGLVARHQARAPRPRVLGVVEPLKIRRRKARRRLLDRLPGVRRRRSGR